MTIEGDKVLVNRTQEELYTLLTDVSRFKEIMPENIEKYEVTGEDSFLFQLKGMPVIKLILTEKTPHSHATLSSASDKFPFTLTCDISEAGDKSEAQLEFNGDFNPMMAMMVKSPLKKFIAALNEGLQAL